MHRIEETLKRQEEYKEEMVKLNIQEEPTDLIFAETIKLTNGEVMCARCAYEGSFNKTGHCPKCKAITKDSRVEVAKTKHPSKTFVINPL